MHHTPRNDHTQHTRPRDGTPPLRGTLRTVAGAVALAVSLTAGQAWALALGRVSVQSLLGEPLRAEIDVPSISNDELATLQIGIAPADRFRAAGMEFNPVLGDVSFELIQRPDGRKVVRLRSNRPINEPFLDLVVQASWANGQLLRGYTLLFDPPNLRQPPAPLAPAIAAAPVTPRATPEPAKPPVANTLPARPPAANGTPSPVDRPSAADRPKQVTVARGDTAGRLAASYKPADVSLEQMLVGLLRANPQAFIGQNVNRLKAGVILDLPDASTLTQIPAGEARQLIAAQSRDFNEYRRRLAAVPTPQAAPAASQAATGQVQTEVKDARPAEAAQDKLTLSKGATATPQEDQIAQGRQQADTQNRIGELNRNLEELEQLKAASSAASEPSPAPAPTATAPSSEAAPAVPAPAPVPAPPAPPAPAPAQAPEADTSGWAAWLQYPLALPVAGGVAVIAGLLALLGIRRRRQQGLARDEAEESRFDSAEGQTVDTSEEAPASSMMYSPSQLDAGGDVDPVAEADVYLAYGRDRQAEEILLEALRLHPERLPVRAKLLEIYAQRSDVAAYNQAAQELFDLTLGEGDEWATARDTGLVLDPDNPLYRSAPSGASVPTIAQASAAVTPSAAVPDLDLDFGAATAPAANAPAPADGPEPPAGPENEVAFDFDLTAPPTEAADRKDIDFELDIGGADAPAPVESAPPPSAEAPTDDGLAFDLDLTPEAEASPPAPATAQAPAESHLDFDLDLSELSAPETPTTPPATSLPEEVRSLSLDLDDTPTAETPQATDTGGGINDLDDLASLEVDEGSGEDPLETKLSLAREFEAIGDTDGARTLAEEVEAEATGDLQARARAFIAQLS